MHPVNDWSWSGLCSEKNGGPRRSTNSKMPSYCKPPNSLDMLRGQEHLSRFIPYPSRCRVPFFGILGHISEIEHGRPAYQKMTLATMKERPTMYRDCSKDEAVCALWRVKVKLWSRMLVAAGYYDLFLDFCHQRGIAIADIGITLWTDDTSAWSIGDYDESTVGGWFCCKRPGPQLRSSWKTWKTTWLSDHQGGIVMRSEIGCSGVSWASYTRHFFNRSHWRISDQD